MHGKCSCLRASDRQRGAKVAVLLCTSIPPSSRLPHPETRPTRHTDTCSLACAMRRRSSATPASRWATVFFLWLKVQRVTRRTKM
eukprot:scaffold30265_cov90-Isochrysis_galbana.AAC.1